MTTHLLSGKTAQIIGAIVNTTITQILGFIPMAETVWDMKQSVQVGLRTTTTTKETEKVTEEKDDG